MNIALGILLLVAALYYVIMLTAFEQNCKSLVKQSKPDERQPDRSRLPD
jgi:hypothetical protein